MGQPHLRRGFGLFELVLAALLIVMIAGKVSLIIKETMDFSSQQVTEVTLESQAEIVLDRITYALLGSDRRTLTPDVTAPLYSSSVGYRISMGVENGEVVWSDPEVIGTDPDADNQLCWTANPGEVSERSVVWSNIVRPLLEGELINGVDDNGNGLVDEKGISFDVTGEAIVVRISLGVMDGEAVLLTRTLETVVTCRNASKE